MVVRPRRAEHGYVDSGYSGWQQQVGERDLRCSDAEREPVIDFLKQAFAEGRLDGEELDMRVHLAMVAKTRGDLAAVTTDLALPAPVPGRRAAGPPSGEDRMLAALAHASGYFTSFLGPLLFLILSGRRSEYVRRHAAEALNFQLTVLLVVVVTFGLGAIVYLVTWILCGIAAIAALADGGFRYPWTLRLVK
jgi:uncharacterized Tic20 family protein